MEKNITGKKERRKERADGSFHIYSHINCCLSYLFIYLFTYFIPWSSLLFFWDGRLKILLITGKKEGKNKWFLPCIFPYQLLLILLIYLLILFRDGSSSREIVVVSLRWSFKNSSDHRKERNKEQMILPMYIPYQLLLILLTYFIPWSFVKSWNRRCFFKMVL